MMRPFRTLQGRPGFGGCPAWAVVCFLLAAIALSARLEAQPSQARAQSADRPAKASLRAPGRFGPEAAAEAAFLQPDPDACSAWTLLALARSPGPGPAGTEPLKDENLSFAEARCWEALGLEEDAVRAYRRHLERYAEGKTRSAAQSALIALLFRQKNFQAVASAAGALAEDQRQALTAEDRYLIGQSLYRLGQDSAARPYLESLGPEAAVSGYALFTLAQMEYRSGNPENALSLLDSLCSPAHASPVSGALRDHLVLTRARILYQLGRYGEAVEEFRSLKPSSPFLPEAFLGLGWSYDALGDRAKAISYFLAVQSLPASPAELSRAQMEAARIYSEAGADPEATELFHQVQVHLLLRIAQYGKWGQEQEWLAEASRALLDPAASSVPPTTDQPVADDLESFRREVLALLDRERSRPGPLRSLLEGQRALDSVTSKLRSLADRQGLGLRPASSPPSSLFPPLDPPVPALAEPVPEFVDIWLSLLYAESRILQAASLWDLLPDAERTDWERTAVSYYRSLVEDILFPPAKAAETRAFFDGLQSTIRHLPYPLEDRNKVLERLLSCRRSIEETRTALTDASLRMETLAGAAQGPTAGVRLGVWMAYAKSLAELRMLRDGSPLLLLAEDPSSESASPASDLSVDSFESRVSERIRVLRGLLLAALERHVSNFHKERISELRRLVADSRRMFADSLLLRQQEITRDLSSSHAEQGRAHSEGAEPENP